LSRLPGKRARPVLRGPRRSNAPGLPAERWFGLLTEQLDRRGVHKSVLALENDVQQMDTNWNQNPKPFVWTSCRGHPPITIEYIAKISDAGH
jgi:hypothetical protein